ncbi:MAG: ATP-binding protein [Candidatus Omnitrophica bacterium]|nr:ATP-binding protein [Candidatus Omnitrophota bacterium]MCM8826572.1 ATP-binding protein [Candidatus Omnitrophota bacterium]
MNSKRDNRIKEFLSLSLERCLKEVGAQTGSIFLLEDSKKELILEVAHHISDIPLESVRKRMGEDIVGVVALQRKSLLVRDIGKEANLKRINSSRRYRSSSFISVPMQARGELVGVINITDKFDGTPFDNNDLNTVERIANYLGIAIHSLNNYVIEQYRLNEQLKKEIAELKDSINQLEKFASIGKMIGGFVHEVNNPLDGIIRYVNLALDCLDEDSLVKSYLTEAKKGLNRLVRFVKVILDFFWGLSLKDKEINIVEAIEEAFLMRCNCFSLYNIKVEKIFPPNLPNIPDFGIKVVFDNLIKNACEAMKEGGVLKVTVLWENGGIKIIFKDNGVGIPKEIQAKIFEPFFTTKSMGEGAGLGLAISREIINRYQGKIYVKSELCKGSEFTVYIPLIN